MSANNFKCKMCGGELDIQPGKTIAECMYCGSKQTIPRTEDERTANLYDRANHFRRNNDFDKARVIYEQILDSGVKDAEAYWSIVLCKYGIEYVEEPKTHKRVPTVNRTSLISIFDDADYKAVLELAGDEQKSIYEAEAREIDRIQSEILKISQREDPFDIFICYKETDDKGRRTPDSVLAYDIYKELTDEGYRVFFSRVTLEDKLGEAYEPYIFAALNSAKIMIAVGTKPEFFNAVWVKNEWSRYLSLIKDGEKKTLIPVYKDMDPYDLPEEFSHLQGQDMSRLGFMQDLVRGIHKIAPLKNSEVSPNEGGFAQQPGSVKERNENLIRRAWDFLEDRRWDDAKKYANQVLDADASNAEAHLLMFMSEHKTPSIDEIVNVKDIVSEDASFKKALRYAEGELRQELEKIEASQKTAFEKENYLQAEKYTRNFLPHNLIKARKIYLRLGTYKDSTVLLGKTTKKLACSIAVFAAVAIAVLGIIGASVYSNAIIPRQRYQQAINLVEEQRYDEAISIFQELGAYNDSIERIKDCEYKKAVAAFESGDYSNARDQFSELGEYEDSEDMTLRCEMESDIMDYGDGSGINKRMKAQFFDNFARYVENEATHDEAVSWLVDRAKEFTDKIGNGWPYYGRLWAIKCYCAAGYDDDSEEVKSVMYAYIRYQIGDGTDMCAYLNYIGEEDLEKLVAWDYRDASDIRKNYTEPRAEVEFEKTSYSRKERFGYCIRLRNMQTGSFNCIYPDGDKFTYNFTEDDIHQYGEIGEIWWENWYNNPSKGRTGTFTVEVYDTSGQLMTKNSCKITE